MYAVTPTPNNECTEFSKRLFGPIAYIHGTALMWPRKVTLRSWCDRVHSRYGVDSIPQSHFKWFLYTLYTVQWHSFGGFYVSFVHSTEYSARLFLKSSELGPPAPSAAGECVSPPPLLWWGGGTLACAWGVHFTELMWPHKVTLRSQQNQHKVTLTTQSDFKSY